jgi:hypothetical protein
MAVKTTRSMETAWAGTRVVKRAGFTDRSSSHGRAALILDPWEFEEDQTASAVSLARSSFERIIPGVIPD